MNRALADATHFGSMRSRSHLGVCVGYLILAILTSFSISLLIKDNEPRGADTEVVLAGNYLTAGAVG